MAGFDAQMYSSNNYVQRMDAVDILTSYFPLMDWSDNATIMDVGTGDGTVLFDVILKNVPQCPEKVIALDVNEDMLHIAKSKCKQNTIVEFVCLDIATTTLPPKLHDSCDHIFSLYCLHWVTDQRQAFENMFKILKPGGDMLLTIAVDHIVGDVYDKMAKKVKWVNLISDFKQSIFPYRNCPNAVTTAESLLKNTGFIQIKCEIVERVSLHKNFLDYGQWTLGTNLFLKSIPHEDVDAYKEDFLSELKNLVIGNNKMKRGEEIYDPYSVLLVFASKPELNKHVS